MLKAKKCLIVQNNDKSMKIGIHGNFCRLISKRSEPTQDFAHEGRNLQSKSADIQNVNFHIILNEVDINAF